MGAPAVGAVILIPFPFSDLSGTKKRPALALADAGRGDWVCAQITSNPYSGINVLMLWSAGLRHGYSSPYWLTYKQAAERGGQVRKGEHGTACVFYKPWESTDTNAATGETETVKGAVLKSFRIFSLDQIDGIEAPTQEERPAFVAIEGAERILNASPAPIQFGGTQAFYRPSDDTIHLPAREAFINPEAFVSV